ncbi:MAG: lipid core-O-antigen ligase-like enyme [Sphingomonadales bacterium]|nr:lipid core-O-antigen ligase-like enyme [Sphingomonadales bacterium]
MMVTVPVIGTFYTPDAYFQSIGVTNLQFGKSDIMPWLLLLFTTSIGVMLLMRDRENPFYHDFLVYAFVLIAFISTTYSPDPASSLNRSLRLLPVVGFGILFSQITTVRKTYRNFTIAFFISSVLSIFMAIVFPQYGLSNYFGAYESLWRGALTDKNAAGFAYGLGLIVTICAYQTKSISLSFASATIIPSVVMIIMSNSITAITGLLVVGTLFTVITFLGRVPRAAVLITVAAITALTATIVLLLIAVPNLFENIAGRSGDLTGRTPIWAAVWILIQKSPWTGYGFNFWAYDTPDRIGIWSAAGFKPLNGHNTWLDLWLQMGLVAVVLIILDFVRSLRLGFKLVSKRVDAALLPVLILIFILVRSISESTFSEPGTAGVFWLTWGSVMLRKVRHDRPGLSPFEASSGPKP